MKNFLIIVAILIISCEKDQIQNISYHNLLSVPDWSTIDFKTEYTIQVPDNFSGIGMAGFEGNTFNKFASDGSISLTYNFCTQLFCYDFGDTLQTPFPNCLVTKNNLGGEPSYRLNRVSKFYNSSDLIGIFYYTLDTLSYGRLYWQDHNYFKQAMKVYFYPSQCDTVLKIISTISEK